MTCLRLIIVVFSAITFSQPILAAEGDVASTAESSTAIEGSTAASTADSAGFGEDEDADLIGFLKSAIQVKNQADAEFIFMTPPGTTDAAQKNGLTLDKVEKNVSKEMQGKDLRDLNWGLYSTPRPGENITGSPISNFLDKHKNYYCSPSSGIEKALGDDSCEKNLLDQEHADLRVASLLAPTIYDGERGKLMADDVIRSLTIPFPDGSLKSKVASGLKSRKDRVYAAETMVRQSVMSVARNSFNEMWAMRMPTETAEKTKLPTGFGKALFGAGKKPEPKSILGVMEEESTRRLKDQQWYGLVEQSSNEALMREMVHMEAFRLWMDYYRYRQSERVEAMLATMISLGVNDSRRFANIMRQQNF